MNIINYPSKKETDKAIHDNEPMLCLISFDIETVILSQIDEAMEHHILLAKTGFKQNDIDKYFRIIFDRDGADWTFVCPPDYKNIKDKQRRIGEFYKDGFSAISAVLHELGYLISLNIPKRYRRHFDMLGE